MKLVNLFLGRLPDRKSILNVYAVIVVLVYSWTLFTSFYKLPSWMFYLTIGQIISVYAYAFSIDLLESLIALAAVLVLNLTIFLPIKNKDEFQSRSIILTVILLGTSMLRLGLFQTYEDINEFLRGETLWWSISIVLGLTLSIFAPKIQIVRNILEGFAERATVLVYIYIPLSILSLIVVLVRNIG